MRLLDLINRGINLVDAPSEYYIKWKLLSKQYKVAKEEKWTQWNAMDGADELGPEFRPCSR
jgi:hypothetical protein